MIEAVDAEFPVLFSHRARADWGVGVLSGERDGKRRYLFEGGEERTIAAAHHHLMQKVENPNRDQQASYARLTALLATRERREPAAGSNGAKAVTEQLATFRREHPMGFSSEAWKSVERNLRVRQAREPSVLQALSANSLDALARSRRLDGVWDHVVALVGESGLAAARLESAPGADDRRQLGQAVRDLLHGKEGYARRFDAFVSRYEAVFREFPDWQAVTALPALIFPLEHVCVEPTVFRKQLKALSRQSVIGARPISVTYERCRSMARALACALAAQGEVPADLLEVHAFILTSFRPAQRAAS